MSIPTIQAADAYHTLRGNDAWEALDTEQKTAALWRADDYLTAFYRFVDYSNEDEDVQAEYDLLKDAAKVVLALELRTAQSLTQTREVVKERKKIDGVVEKEFEYSNAPSDPYPQVTAMLRPILVQGRSSGFTVVNLTR